jgi:hypothetical protein
LRGTDLLPESLLFRSRRCRAMTAISAISPTASPHTLTRIPKHLRDASQIGVGFGFSDHARFRRTRRFRRSSCPSPSLPIPDWRRFERHHPKPSQIGVGFSDFTQFGVGFSDFTHALCGKGIRVWLWLKAKGQELKSRNLALLLNFQRTCAKGRLGGSTKLEKPPAWDTTK